MCPEPLEVSAIIIFKDEERFLAEAIESVVTQTFTDWELLLVDDGSTDGSSDIAIAAVTADPNRCRYLQHPGGLNQGMSASRNLGLAAARGRYIAFLDGDDVWLPTKLAKQRADLERHREAAMTYGPLLRWLRWTGDPDAIDHEDLMGVGRRKFGRHPQAGTVVEPPALVRHMLRDDYFIPSGALIERQVFEEVGPFEPMFTGLYEDAVMMIKICLAYPVLVVEDVTYLYRIHPDSHTQRSTSDAEIDHARMRYLRWVGCYLRENAASSRSLRRAHRRATWSTRQRRQRWHRAIDVGRRVGRMVMPRATRDRLRRWWFDRTRPPELDR